MDKAPTIYRYSRLSTYRIRGWYPSYGLDYRHGCTDDFCDVVRVDLPDGYDVVTCCDGLNRLQDANGNVCDLVANKNYGFWIMPVNGGELGSYVHVEDPVINEDYANDFVGTFYEFDDSK